MNIATLDWMVIGAYFVVITAIGLIAGYRVRQTGEYFLGGRRFGPWLMMGQSFGVGTHAEMPVALAGAVYSVGASAIWFQWKNLFITPFYWLMAPVFRRIRRTTMAELTEDRYGPWMAAIYIVFARVLLHHQHRQHAERRGQGHQPGDRRRRRRERDRRGDDGHVHVVQLRRRVGRGGLDRSVPGLPDHRALVHARPAGLPGGRRSRRHPGLTRAIPPLALHAIRHRALDDRDAHAQRAGRDHGAAAPAGDGRHRQGRAHLPRRHVLRQHDQARVHGGVGAGRPDCRGHGRPGTCRRRGDRRSGECVRLRLPSAAVSRAPWG